MMPSLEQHRCRPEPLRLSNLLPDFLGREKVGFGMVRGTVEAKERTSRYTDVGVIGVGIDHKRHVFFPVPGPTASRECRLFLTLSASHPCETWQEEVEALNEMV